MVLFYGTPDGVHVGQQFVNRAEMKAAGLHSQLQAGISGNGKDGADAIVLSGGYEDDRDYGDEIIYTGHGGQNLNNKQVADQSPSGAGNAGLITSLVSSLPVRVFRGAKWSSPFSPPGGYRYAGLYLVTDHWRERGTHGFIVMRFKLERIAEQEQYVTDAAPDPGPEYKIATVSRRIRDTAMTRQLKRCYEDRCQVCQSTIVGIGGRSYSEGAHVRPLGRPHLGPDLISNILCLCPNHHAQLDLGGLIIQDDMTITNVSSTDAVGSLHFRGDHKLDISNVRYHRAHWESFKLAAHSTPSG